uniref:Uncharacterized protein n=1 Tax=Moniliophthora roreri TaxID=221103 RepID=A0A0W0G7U1_MONRR
MSSLVMSAECDNLQGNDRARTGEESCGASCNQVSEYLISVSQGSVHELGQ